MSKKTQISLFVIISVVVLFMLFFIFYISSDERVKNMDEVVEMDGISSLSISNVDDYVNNCLDEVSKVGVFELGKNGGYIYSYDDVVLAEYERTAFHLRNGESTSPSIEFMENELDRFIQNSLFLCVANLDIIDYNLSLSKAKVESNIRLNKVEVKVDFPVTLFKDGMEKSVSNFKYSLPVRLGHILNIKDDILVNSDDFIDFNEFMDYDVEVNLMPYNKDIIVYSLYDNLSSFDVGDVPFVFNFAVEEHGNSAPKLDFVPDFVMGLDDVFKYNLSGKDIDGDDLIFYSLDSELSVFGDGEVYFKPTSETEYVFDVCVKDVRGMSDCSEVKFMVSKDEY